MRLDTYFSIQSHRSYRSDRLKRLDEPKTLTTFETEESSLPTYVSDEAPNEFGSEKSNRSKIDDEEVILRPLSSKKADTRSAKTKKSNKGKY